MHRLFVAIDVPDSVKSGLGAALRRARRERVKRPQLHLTLRFIGEVDTAQFKAIGEALRGVESGAFDMALNGVGRFPPKGAPRVLWVGVQERPALSRLYGQIEAALGTVGVKPDDRSFSAHITLARLRTPPPRVVVDQYLSKHRSFQSETVPVREFILYSSVLAPAGRRTRQRGVMLCWSRTCDMLEGNSSRFHVQSR
jgi:2'-5' RNA ligase